MKKILFRDRESCLDSPKRTASLKLSKPSPFASTKPALSPRNWICFQKIIEGLIRLCIGVRDEVLENPIRMRKAEKSSDLF